MIIYRLIRESFLFAIDSMMANKLRTFLSLLGITIGIFAMISVFTVIDSLKQNIEGRIQSLGSDVIYIQSMPWDFSSDHKWWEYIRRPDPDYEEYKMIKKLSRNAAAVALKIDGRLKLKFGNNSLERAKVLGITADYGQMNRFIIQNGRSFTDLEIRNGRAVAVIGHEIKTKLFPSQNAVGKRILMKGRKVDVIGVLEKEGDGMGFESKDDQVFIPIRFAANFFRIKGSRTDGVVSVKAKENISNEALIDELTGIMRSLRKLKPKAKDNFALNQQSMFTQGFEKMFGVINLAGFTIGIFSIIVGGFSIANIMFVSVKERTGLIGIQKSLGAKNYFVLLQFLFESIFLCLIGGVAGLFLIFLGTLLVTYGLDFELHLGWNNVFLGLLISIIIGVISGIVPSFQASRLDPVEAIRAN